MQIVHLCETRRSGPRICLSLTLFKDWQPRGKHLYLEIASIWEFSSESLYLKWSKLFLPYYQIVTNTFLGLSENYIPLFRIIHHLIVK